MRVWRFYSLVIVFFLFLFPVTVSAQALDSEIHSVAAQLAEDLKRAKVKRVATADFIDYRNRSNMLGRYIADTLTTGLFMAASKGEQSAFELVERARLEAILRELKLSAAGLVNPDNARKVGNIAGVDALIVGNLVDMGETIAVTVRVISTETARVLSARRFTFLANAAQRKLLRVILSSNTGNSVTSESVEETTGDSYAEGKGLKTAFFITRPVGATYFAGYLTVSMEIKNYTNKKIFIGFLKGDDKKGIRSSVIMDGAVSCRAIYASPLPSFADDFFTWNRRHEYPYRYLSYITPQASTVLTVKFECPKERDVGNMVKSFDIGLHVGLTSCEKEKGEAKCPYSTTKTSVAVRGIPIKKKK